MLIATVWTFLGLTATVSVILVCGQPLYGFDEDDSPFPTACMRAGDLVALKAPQFLSSSYFEEGDLSTAVFSGRIHARLENSGTYKEDGMASSNDPSWIEPLANVSNASLTAPEAVALVHAIKEHAANTPDDPQIADEEALATLEQQLLAEAVADDFAGELLAYCDLSNPTGGYELLERFAEWNGRCQIRENRRQRPEPSHGQVRITPEEA